MISRSGNLMSRFAGPGEQIAASLDAGEAILDGEIIAASDHFRDAVGHRQGHKLFELICAHDLEGSVAKRLKDPHGPLVRQLKITNPGYSQNEGRHELFDRSTARGEFEWRSSCRA
jgi:ATP-dependent DNA ligase